MPEFFQKLWKLAGHFDTAAGLFSWTGIKAILAASIPTAAVIYFGDAARNPDLVIFFSLGAFAFTLLIIYIWQVLPLNRSEKIWFERNRLELYVLAYLSLWKKPKLPIDIEPELTRHRYLKDAIEDGDLIADLKGEERPNISSTVTIQEFKRFAEERKHADFIKLAKRWEKANPGIITITDGVNLQAKPDLKLNLSGADISENIVTITSDDGKEAKYNGKFIHVIVLNRNIQRIKGCRAYLRAIEHYANDGSHRLSPTTNDNIPLIWSRVDIPEIEIEQNIQKRIVALCALENVLDENRLFFWKVPTGTPTNLVNWFQPHGVYRLHIMVTGEGVETESIILEVWWDGTFEGISARTTNISKYDGWQGEKIG